MTPAETTVSEPPEATQPDPRSRLPSMDRLLEAARREGWMDRWGRSRVKEALSDVLEGRRRRLGAALEEGREGARRSGGSGPAVAGSSESDILADAKACLTRGDRASLRPVVNGTGVVLHTNLGRAPLSDEALKAVVRVAGGYSNLELDLSTGERGSRQAHCSDLLSALTGAEASLVVNNNAAAVSLAVHGLAEGREVVVSRGELVEIGGSFRLPRVVEGSGGRLVEVGTTNRTRISDFAEACGTETGALLKVHPSNYRLEGFAESVALEELVELGRDLGVPVIHDLGSGLLRPEWLEGFPPEPSPRESLDAGADVVTWSADKLLGGPQAGILNGREGAMARIRRDPLARAFRVDKTILAALEATLRLYRRPGRAARAIPALHMLTETRSEVERRARTAAEKLQAPTGVHVHTVPMDSVVGGGAYPGFTIESAGWTVEGVPGHRVAAVCRSASPPVLGTVREERFRVDFRTVLPREGPVVARVLTEALAETTAAGTGAIGGSDESGG